LNTSDGWPARPAVTFRCMVRFTCSFYPFPARRQLQRHGGPCGHPQSPHPLDRSLSPRPSSFRLACSGSRTRSVTFLRRTDRHTTPQWPSDLTPEPRADGRSTGTSNALPFPGPTARPMDLPIARTKRTLQS